MIDLASGVVPVSHGLTVEVNEFISINTRAGSSGGWPTFLLFYFPSPNGGALPFAQQRVG
ncbi:MAG: hypothetical protein JWM83_622 [Candidatus Angelobacter sp.]|nr:hypothetical protein [Candidatus Angelobacter sp.]